MSFPENSNVTNNGVFIFNNAGIANVAGSISGTGTLIMEGTGTVILIGTNTFAGPLTINSGTVQINEPLSLPVGINVIDDGTLSFSHWGSLTAGGVISGTGGVSVISGRTLILTNVNAYLNGTVISNNGSVNEQLDSQLGAATGPITSIVEHWISPRL